MRTLLLALLLALVPGWAWAQALQPPGGGFLLPETVLLLADGTEKTAEEVKPGDLLKTERGPGFFGSVAVKRILPRIIDEYTVLKVNGTVVRAAGKLAFLTEDRRWITLDKLNEGSMVWVLIGETLALKPIQQIRRYPASIRVYKIELDQKALFFAGKTAVGD